MNFTQKFKEVTEYIKEQTINGANSLKNSLSKNSIIKGDEGEIISWNQFDEILVIQNVKQLFAGLNIFSLLVLSLTTYQIFY